MEGTLTKTHLWTVVVKEAEGIVTAMEQRIHTLDATATDATVAALHREASGARTLLKNLKNRIEELASPVKKEITEGFADVSMM